VVAVVECTHSLVGRKDELGLDRFLYNIEVHRGLYRSFELDELLGGVEAGLSQFNLVVMDELRQRPAES